jgi:hypothetical protein
MRALLVPAAALSLLLAACGAKMEQPGFGDVLMDAGADAKPDGYVSIDDIGLLDQGTVDAAPPPVEIASVATARFGVTNASGADRWVATQGFFCEGAEIARMDSSGVPHPVPRSLGFQCLCECPNPSSGVATWRKIAAGEMFRFEWDGRGLVTYSTPYDCSAHGFPGQGATSELHGVLQPVAPGSYYATVLVRDAPPTGCNQQGSDPIWQCNSYGSGFPSAMPPAIAQTCPANGAGTASHGFTLPASGAVDVAITLP